MIRIIANLCFNTVTDFLAIVFFYSIIILYPLLDKTNLQYNTLIGALYISLKSVLNNFGSYNFGLNNYWNGNNKILES